MHSQSLRTKFNWWDMKDRQFLYLKPGVLQTLTELGAEKAGSFSKLCKRIGTTHLYYGSKIGAISVRNLKRLLNFVGKNYSFANSRIAEIRKGKKASIRNPRFPINLLNPSVGSLLGHIVSDGCLSHDRCRRNYVRTNYYSGDKQALRMFVCDLNEVFGDVHFSEGSIRNCGNLRIGNSVVSMSLKRAGAPVGKKYKLNSCIPFAVNIGGREFKRKYLSAIFDDEGSVGRTHSSPYIILSRNIHIELTAQEKEIINRYALPKMSQHVLPTGHINHRIAIRKLAGILKDLDQALYCKIASSKPHLLVDESRILREEFKIENSTYVMAFGITNNGGYSVSSSLVIRRKTDVIKFYKEVGFCLDRKQNKLGLLLANKGWINHDAASL